MYFLDDLDEEEYEIAIKVGFLTNFIPLNTKRGFKGKKSFTVQSVHLPKIKTACTS